MELRTEVSKWVMMTLAGSSHSALNVPLASDLVGCSQVLIREVAVFFFFFLFFFFLFATLP